MEFLAFERPPFLLDIVADLVKRRVESLDAFGDAYEMQTERRRDRTGPFTFGQVDERLGESVAEIAADRRERR